jgi:hypothetical protein
MKLLRIIGANAAGKPLAGLDLLVKNQTTQLSHERPSKALNND